MKQVTYDQIEEEFLCCPYCMGEVRSEQFGCCGESSAHFQTAYVVDGESFLEDDIEIVDENSAAKRESR